MPLKAKRRYLLTIQVRRYRLLASQGRAVGCVPLIGFPLVSFIFPKPIQCQHSQRQTIIVLLLTQIAGITEGLPD